MIEVLFVKDWLKRLEQPKEEHNTVQRRGRAYKADEIVISLPKFSARIKDKSVKPF